MRNRALTTEGISAGDGGAAAWPGRGFWPGTSHGQAGTLTAMVQSMATTSQPRLLSALVNGFASFGAAHGSSRIKAAPH
jgi:hypothetical protein